MSTMINDIRLRESMKIILRPVAEKEDEYIRRMNADTRPAPATLHAKLQMLLAKHILKERRKHRMTWLKRSAIIAAVILMLAMAACMAIEPLREKIFSYFVTWYEDYFELKVDTSATTAMDDDTPVPLGTFNYIPEGYEIVEDIKIGYIRKVVMMDHMGGIIRFNVDKQKLPVHFDELYQVQESTINNTPVLVVTGADNKDIYIVWSDELVRYDLSGNISFDELKKMIEHLS